MTLTNAGVYHGKTGGGWWFTDANKLLIVGLQFELTHEEVNGDLVELDNPIMAGARIYLTSKKQKPITRNINSIAAVYGWDGKNIAQLEKAIEKEGVFVKVKAVEDTYNDETRIKIDAIATEDGQFDGQYKPTGSALESTVSEIETILNGGRKPVAERKQVVPVGGDDIPF